MTRQEREELNKLSKQVFGTTSRWQKIVDKGVAEPFERDREVMVPRANGMLEKKTFTDKKSVIKHYSVEEVRKLMEDILAERKSRNAPIDAIKPGDTAVLTSNDLLEKGMTVKLSDGTELKVE